MTMSHAAPARADDVIESVELAPRINGFHLERRCRVCRNDSVRRKVNQMLAMGAPYAGIVRALAADNAEFDDRNRIALDSIRTDTTKHFPVQSVAKASYRATLERRAQENRVDFVEGVGTALIVGVLRGRDGQGVPHPGGRRHRGQCGDRRASRREASVRPRRA